MKFNKGMTDKDLDAPCRFVLPDGAGWVRRGFDGWFVSCGGWRSVYYPTKRAMLRARPPLERLIREVREQIIDPEFGVPIADDQGTGLSFQIAPEDQGQIVEYSYAQWQGRAFMRRYDRSEGVNGLVYYYEARNIPDWEDTWNAPPPDKADWIQIPVNRIRTMVERDS